MVSLGRDLTRMTIPTLVQRAQQGYRMADLRGFSMPFILGATQETFEQLMIVDLLQDTSNNGRFCRVGAQRRVLFAI